MTDKQGQLLLPVLVVMFLFAMSWVAYAQWCRKIYWTMRMDMAADATALSASRTEAAMLNTIGSIQILANSLMQKARVGEGDFGVMQLSAVSSFERYNVTLKALVSSYAPETYRTAKMVAKANGANKLPVALPPPQHHLKPQPVTVLYFKGVIPAGRRLYPAAYFARDWWPRKQNPQPVHRNTWLVCRDKVCEKGKARVWLDVKAEDPLNNGGFPSDHPSLWGGIGIQCHYPQFNARLMPKFFSGYES